ncbi:MAG: glucuronate isomerase [Kiritimatiellae bacterium]|nr:glucuronate isomerase [Kiritimatiellia bacterium]
MKKPFIHDDFLLTTKTARALYHEHAERMPIIDYHCHLPPQEIAEDQRWSDVSDVWLGGDHYKWRQMRACGFDERFCSGRGDDGRAGGWERFEAYAKTMERLVGNPLFDWSHLELARHFGVFERLCGASAKRIYAKCNRALAEKDFSARGLMKKSRVEVVCTTDDPDDDLRFHERIAAEPFGTKILPAWRPDRVLKEAVRTKKDPMAHLAERHRHFEAHGCKLSDYGLVDVPESGRYADWLFECLKMDARAGWTTQLHFNCLRDLNTRAFRRMGPDAGCDAINDSSPAKGLAKLLDRLEREDALPRMILYSLNPNDVEAVASIIGCFQKGPGRGKLQLGAAWWFLDQKDGIKKQLEALASLGALGNFVGMLTDSRSFLSYVRHEYFRRILCRKLGEEVERGEIPNDLKWLGGIVEDVSYNNAKNYFGF